MAAMFDDAWEATKQSLKIGARVRCRIKEHCPYGVHVCIDGVQFDGLVQITDFEDYGRMTPAEYPILNSVVEAVVLGYKENSKQIWLGMKPSQMLTSEINEDGNPQVDSSN
jgi:ribosomal protein S1